MPCRLADRAASAQGGLAPTRSARRLVWRCAAASHAAGPTNLRFAAPPTRLLLLPRFQARPPVLLQRGAARPYAHLSTGVPHRWYFCRLQPAASASPSPRPWTASKPEALSLALLLQVAPWWPGVCSHHRQVPGLWSTGGDRGGRGGGVLKRLSKGAAKLDLAAVTEIEPPLSSDSSIGGRRSAWRASRLQGQFSGGQQRAGLAARRLAWRCRRPPRPARRAHRPIQAS